MTLVLASCLAQRHHSPLHRAARLPEWHMSSVAQSSVPGRVCKWSARPTVLFLIPQGLSQVGEHSLQYPAELQCSPLSLVLTLSLWLLSVATSRCSGKLCSRSFTTDPVSPPAFCSSLRAFPMCGLPLTRKNRCSCPPFKPKYF